MKTSTVVWMVVTVFIVAGGAWYWVNRAPVAPVFTIDGKSVTLVNGRSETPAAPGSAEKVVTQYFGNVATGDLNDDGMPDIAFLITQNSGGSGTFYYVVATLVATNGTYRGTNAILLGDRIAPQTTEIRNGQVIVNYVERAAGEPMTAQPSVGVSKYLKVEGSMLVPAGANLSQTYSNTLMKFSLQLPEGYTADESYKYQELGPGKDIAGIKFAIPAGVAAGTNLGSDSYISVEKIPQTPACSATPFLGQGTAALAVSDADTTYSVASSAGAAAGNRYEETVYAFPASTNPCIAVRYFIHYGVIENYPPGAVREFDKSALLVTFDAIRHSLKVVQ